MVLTERHVEPVGEALRYELVPGWEQLPSGMTHLDAPGVAVDSQDRVYVLGRHQHRVLVYAPDGSLLSTLLGNATMTKWAAPFVEADPEMSALREQHAEDVAAQERVFEGPMGIEVDEQDRILIADCCKHRLQVYERV